MGINEIYLRMAILLLPYVDYSFFNKYEYEKKELEELILLSLVYHGHIVDVDKSKNIISFYYPEEKYDVDKLINKLEELSSSLLTYHNDHIMVDIFHHDSKHDEILAPFHNKILPFVEVNKLISDNLLMVMYNYYYNYSLEYVIKNNLITPISVVDFQLSNILNEGIAETHTHLFGSIPFEVQWGWLMEKLHKGDFKPVENIINNLEKNKGIIYYKKKFYIDGNLSKIILDISLIRLIFMQYINVFKISDMSFETFMKKNLNLYNFDRYETDLYVEMIKNYITPQCGDKDIDMEIFNQLINKITNGEEFYFLKNLMNSVPLEVVKYFEKKIGKTTYENEFYESMKEYNVIEYIFLNLIYSIIKKSNDSYLKKYFFQYIRYKNLFHSMLNYSADIKGFFEFQMYFANQHSLIDTTSLLFTPIFQTYANENVKYLEIRVGHVNLKNKQLTVSEIMAIMEASLKKFCESYKKYLVDNNNFTKAGIVIHFNKRLDDDFKCWYDFIEYDDKYLLNYAQYREECFINLAVIESIRSTVPHADKYIIAIDAASNELATEPWVLAPIFRSVKDRWKYDLEKVMNYYDLPYKRCLPLGITYHVGEVFSSIVSGLRHVDEVIDYYGFQNGERLGHATVIGIDTDKYSREQKIITLPVIELMDNWLWLYHLKSEYNLFNKINMQYIEEKIWYLVHIIYEDSDGHIPGHISIHKLYEAYKMQFEINNVNFKYFKKCSFGKKNYPCYFAKEDNEWSSYNLFFSRHCRCFLKRMNHMVQQEIDNDIQREIYSEAQQFVVDKIALKGIVVEVNPISNANIGNVDNVLDHPVIRMNDTYKNEDISRHIITTINTDNPGVFGTTLSNQFGFIEQSLLERGYSKEAVLKWLNRIRINGINSTFIHYKNALKKDVIEELTDIKEYLESK